MVANLLGRLIAKVEAVGLVEGFLAIIGSPSVLFIQFANSSLFLLKAQMEGLRNLRCIFLIVEAATRLKVNWSNSSFCLVKNVPELEEIANVLGCEVTHLPISYLGFSLGANSNSKEIWNSVLERMGNNLAHWKGNYLSQG